MKRILSLIFAIFIKNICVYSQIDSVAYHFDIVSGIATENMTGATTLCGPGNSNPLQLAAFDSGFRFTFAGIPYDSFSVCPKGWIRLGTLGVAQNTVNFPLHNKNYPVIGPYWVGGNTGSNGYIKSKMFGTAPNRKFVIEWFIAASVTPSVADSRFQLWLNENGTIQIVYGALADPALAFMSYKVFMGAMVNNLESYADLIINSPIQNSQITYNIFHSDFTYVIPAGTSFIFTGDTTRIVSPQIIYVDTCSTCIKMSWIDHSYNEKYFNILKSVDNIHFNFYKTVVSRNSAGTGDTLSFRDTLLLMDSSYYYKIVASSQNNSDTNNFIISTHTRSGPILQGIKSIPGDYPNLSEAFASFACDQLAGPLICELTPAYTSSSETFPIRLLENANTDSIKTITIKLSSSNNGSTISKTITDRIPMFDFSNVRYLFFDGRAGGSSNIQGLTIENADTSGGLINISNGCNHLAFSYCDFKAACNKDTVSSILIGRSLNTYGNNHLLFDNNKFHSTASQLSQRMVRITGDSLKDIFDIKLSNNEFFDLKLNGVSNYMIKSNQFVDNLVLEANSFYNTTQQGISSGNTPLFLDMDVGENKYLEINSNYFGGSAANCGGLPLSINGPLTIGSISTRSNAYISVQGNSFKNFQVTSTLNLIIGTSGYLSNWNLGNMIPNLIGDMTDTNSIHAAGFYGFLIHGDSVRINNNRFSGIQSQAFNYCIVTTGNNLTIEDNIIGNPQFMGSLTTIGNDDLTGIYAYSLASLSIRRNKIGGLYAMSTSNSNTNYVSGITVNQFSSGGFRNVYITDNEIKDLYSNSGTSYIYDCATCFTVTGILLYTYDDSVYVENNLIHNIVSTNLIRDGLEAMGMSLNCDGPNSFTKVNRNNVHHLYALGTSSFHNISGILLDDTGMDLISNNFVGLHLDSMVAISYTGGIVGIGGWAKNLIHNTISVTRGYTAELDYHIVLNVSNNILHSFAGFAPVQPLLGNGHMQHCDYNLISGTQSDLTSWQSSGYDVHSIVGDPLFINANGNDTTLDLHVLNNSPVESSGDSTNSVMFDIDNEVRVNYTPVDIGADAINFLPTSIALEIKPMSLVIYPNPTEDRISIENLPSNHECRVRMIDTMGRCVLNRILSDNILTLENIGTGVYLIEFVEGGSIFRGTIIKL